MVDTLGELREDYGWAAMHKAEAIANEHKDEKRPFYIMCFAKADPNLRGAIVNGMYVSGGIRETWRWSHARPPKVIGMLVWYVDNALGKFEIVDELSLPPDIPLDPSLLSDRSEDQYFGVMEQGKKNRVLVS